MNHELKNTLDVDFCVRNLIEYTSLIYMHTGYILLQLLFAGFIPLSAKRIVLFKN